MNYNELYIPAKAISFKNNDYGNNRGSDTLETPGVISDPEKAMKNHLSLRLHDMEVYNIFLEKLVENRTNKLTDVVATNTKFISILAHDLRSPFGCIIGALEILKEKLKNSNNNDVEEYVNIASNSANRTLDLLDNLLTWTISQNKEKSFNPVRINLYEMIKDEMLSIDTSARQKQILIKQSLEPDLFVQADIQMLKTILRNLISNSIKYTNTGGEINISASKDRNFVEISVSDSGIGISEEVQNKLFKLDLFQSTTGTNNEKGTGLGLIICKEFIELHNGKISIESKEGKGSIFSFTIPHSI